MNNNTDFNMCAHSLYTFLGSAQAANELNKSLMKSIVIEKDLYSFFSEKLFEIKL